MFNASDDLIGLLADQQFSLYRHSGHLHSVAAQMSRNPLL